MWEQFKILLPSIVGHWVVLVVLATGGWFLFTKFYKHFAFKWELPVLVATVVHLFMTANLFVNLYQNGVMFAYQQAVQQAQAQARNQQQPQQQQNVDPATQMKANFLTSVESLVQDPAQINDENKAKLFGAFKELFADKKARAEYAKSISDVYQCQLHFWEDALASFNAKQPTKSDARKGCEKKSGAFFGREKLITLESSKNNDQTIAELAARTKRVPASDGKQVEVTEGMVREALDAQIKATYNLKKIFE
ncbi:MAG: hypothetical protein SGI74_00270 [Oligoflexia bacterium]|nr:hypothetical protein [Oligoflexia bacterium]